MAFAVRSPTGQRSRALTRGTSPPVRGTAGRSAGEYCSLADPPRRVILFYGMVTWVHLDMKTTFPRSSYVKPVQVATATVWLETVTGEPC